jgi:MFS family permease
MTAGRASGGPIGGYLTDTVGWRWSFLGQCPPIVLTILLIWLLIPNQNLGSAEVQMLEKLGRIDFVGSLLLGLAILLFLLPLEIGGTFVPWGHPLVVGLFAGSLMLIVFYILYEELWAKEPILSPRLLATRSVLVSNIIMFCQAAAQLGVSTFEDCITFQNPNLCR